MLCGVLVTGLEAVYGKLEDLPFLLRGFLRRIRQKPTGRCTEGACHISVSFLLLHGREAFLVWSGGGYCHMWKWNRIVLLITLAVLIGLAAAVMLSLITKKKQEDSR